MTRYNHPHFDKHNIRCVLSALPARQMGTALIKISDSYTQRNLYGGFNRQGYW
jgi:hypothetical protein